jgi:hypothetical protein
MEHVDHRIWLKGSAPVVLAGLLGWSAAAVAQSQPATKTVPDAQVEASVLKGLAGAPDLANQAITTTTVYGVVTLSGSVETEALRTEAETIASRTPGVQKVVDEMTLGATPAMNAQAQGGGSSMADAQGTAPQLQSDGTMAPAQQQPQGAPIAQGGPDSDNTSPASGQAAPPPAQAGNGQNGPYRQPYGAPAPPSYGPQRAYNGAPQPVYGGQLAGETVTIPSGAMLRIRINQSLDSGHTKAGTTFDGVVVSDVVAGGAVAIPRGAAVQGTVVEAKKSGALAGRGELSLQLTQVTMGGQTYPIVSDVWAHNGGDKTIQTVNSTAIGGGVGALVGAAAGGGAGAAIGAGVGGLLGLGSSAASGGGQVYVPSEGLLTFHITQPATVATVSQEEMDRLAQGVGPASQPRPLVRRYPPPYYGPVYYRPYPY